MTFKPGSLEAPAVSFEAKRRLLYKLGYFISEEIQDFSSFSKVVKFDENCIEFKDAVKKFQVFYAAEYARQFDGLPAIDGIFGNKTAQAAENMLANRYCNHPDISPQPLEKGLRRWGFMDVTYGHELQKLPNVNASQIHKAYVRAAESWNNICGLKAKYIEQTGSANIQAYAKRIDGRGGTLAWSYLPGNGAGRSTQLEQRYDTSDRYSDYTFAEEVIKHEYGHALGFDHDNGRDSNGHHSIMHASAIGIPKQNLVDIKGAVTRYGKATAVTPTPDDTTPADPPAEAPPYGGVITLEDADGTKRTFIELVKGRWV